MVSGDEIWHLWSRKSLYVDRRNSQWNSLNFQVKVMNESLPLISPAYLFLVREPAPLPFLQVKYVFIVAEVMCAITHYRSWNYEISLAAIGTNASPSKNGSFVHTRRFKCWHVRSWPLVSGDGGRPCYAVVVYAHMISVFFSSSRW